MTSKTETQKINLTLQDRQARLRMARMEETMRNFNHQLGTLANTLNQMAIGLSGTGFAEPVGGNCPQCNLYINYTMPDSNIECTQEDCPCGLNPQTHDNAINS